MVTIFAYVYFFLFFKQDTHCFVYLFFLFVVFFIFASIYVKLTGIFFICFGYVCNIYTILMFFFNFQATHIIKGAK